VLVGTVRQILTWRKITVAVCLETELRISGEAAMIDGGMERCGNTTNKSAYGLIRSLHDRNGKHWHIPNVNAIGRPYKDRSSFEKGAKRVLKMSKLEERKIERRAKEKPAKKEKKRKRAEKIAAGEQVSEDERSQKRAKVHGTTKQPFAARVVLDFKLQVGL
jgi:hypothetical protein